MLARKVALLERPERRHPGGPEPPRHTAHTHRLREADERREDDADDEEPEHRKPVQRTRGDRIWARERGDEDEDQAKARHDDPEPQQGVEVATGTREVLHHPADDDAARYNSTDDAEPPNERQHERGACEAGPRAKAQAVHPDQEQPEHGEHDAQERLRERHERLVPAGEVGERLGRDLPGIARCRRLGRRRRVARGRGLLRLLVRHAPSVRGACENPGYFSRRRSDSTRLAPSASSRPSAIARSSSQSGASSV